MRMKRGDALQVQEYEENQKYNQYTIGISAQRDVDPNRAQWSDNSEASEQEEETIGIKIIVSLTLALFYLIICAYLGVR